MKRTAPFLFSVMILLALTLTSCYWRPDFNSGGLQVDLSGITPRVGNDGEVIRIYLFADGLLFSAGGGSPFVAEIPASSYSQEQKVNISGLPVGPKYRAMVGVGPVNSGLFAPSYYGDSGPFLINPNADTSVTVTMQDISYPSTPSFELQGKNLKGVVENSYSVFTAEENKVHFTYYYPDTWYLDSFDLVLDTYLDQAQVEQSMSGYLIRGLSKGSLYQNNVLDTNKGLVPFFGGDGWTFQKEFSQGQGGSVDAAQSGSFAIPATDIDYAVFFRRQNGLGGTYVPNKDYSLPSAWKWFNVGVDTVRDMVVSSRNAYFAAGGAAFALPPAFLADGNLEGRRVNLPSPAPVLSLGFRPDPQGLPGGNLSLGTANGVYQLTVDETTGAQATAGPTQVMETAGDIIERIAILNSPTDSISEAYLSRQYLYIRDYNGSLYKIPFFAVFPGRATGLAWDYNGVLYVSGTEGLAAIYVGTNNL